MIWFPTSKKEMEAAGWERPDVILFTGDAYIDHPSFGAAVIARVLESAGMKVALTEDYTSGDVQYDKGTVYYYNGTQWEVYKGQDVAA